MGKNKKALSSQPLYLTRFVHAFRRLMLEIGAGKRHHLARAVQ
jgi:hypothetical protein